MATQSPAEALAAAAKLLKDAESDAASAVDALVTKFVADVRDVAATKLPPDAGYPTALRSCIEQLAATAEMTRTNQLAQILRYYQPAPFLPGAVS